MQQNVIIVDTSACKVKPGRRPIYLDWRSGLHQLIENRVEFHLRNADGILWVIRIVRVGGIKIIGDKFQSQKTGTDVQRCGSLIENIKKQKESEQLNQVQFRRQRSTSWQGTGNGITALKRSQLHINHCII